MQIARTDIGAWFEKNLRPSEFKDYAHNGFQVLGPDRYDQLVFALDGCLEVFEKAPERSLIIVHHGIIWGGVNRIDEELDGRLRVLFGKKQGLYACHLPLDSHQEFGTAASVAKRLGLKKPAPFGHENGVPLGQRAELPRPMLRHEFVELVKEKLEAPAIQSILAGKEQVRSVGIVTGGGGSFVSEAMELGLDVMMTGDPKFTMYHPMREAGMNVVFAGHCPTERWAMPSLQAAVEKDFPGLRTMLIETPTGL